jgi:hypothetical protein
LFPMKARFVRATAAMALILTATVEPVWCAPTSDTATVGDDARTAGHAVAHGAATVGHTVAGKSREAGHEIAHDTRSARDTIRDDSKKTGHAIADGARNLGQKVRAGMERLKAAFTGKPAEPAPKG